MNAKLANFQWTTLVIALVVFFYSPITPAGVQEDFFWAIEKGNPTQAAEWLKKGANIDAPNAEGYTPLMVAAQTTNLQIAQFLVEAGANPNIRNRYGETAIMLASYHGQTDMVRLLHLKGADIHHDGWNPLLYAAFNGHLDTIRWLLDSHVNINATSDNGTTPLMMAVRGNHRDAVALLLSKGADPAIKNEQGDNALIWAEKRDHQSIVKLLKSQNQPK